MTALIIILIILAIFALIALCPVGIDAAWWGGEFSLAIRAWLFTFALPSGGEKRQKKQKKQKKQKPPAGEGKPAAAKPQYDLEFFLGLARAGLRAVKKFFRRLDVDALTAHVTVASPDPYATAMTYGYLSAAMETLVPAAESVLRVKNSDISVDADFVGETPVFDFRIVLTIRIGAAVAVGAAFLKEFLREKKLLKKRSQEKTEAERIDK